MNKHTHRKETNVEKKNMKLLKNRTAPDNKCMDFSFHMKSIHQTVSADILSSNFFFTYLLVFFFFLIFDTIRR